ncbi:hypothetical protein MJO28_007311 [Puccinia striiformis f. sp. tritici]|uniref:Uncharacterized protein n=1 Tax=Puccinia striiformis f. sp. tritici TaxID=168172 RepID=A0ACC0EH10_9BASI|nr:hypothetical protein MJO28_007311 [Puccinia striiformis f. sp. tritici]
MTIPMDVGSRFLRRASKNKVLGAFIEEAQDLKRHFLEYSDTEKSDLTRTRMIEEEVGLIKKAFYFLPNKNLPSGVKDDILLWIQAFAYTT